ncbi:hypothetical protein ACSBO6_18715 [Bacillus sp. AL-1R]
MSLINSLFLAIIFTLTLMTTGGVVSANASDKQKPLEKFNGLSN